MKKKNLIFQAQTFKDDLSQWIGHLDYSFKSLARIEELISNTIQEAGKPIDKSFFSTEISNKTFALGCYTGEVIRRNLTTTSWKIDSESESPLSISLTNSSGAIGYVINKAYKRIYEGDGDNLLHFAKVMVTDLLKENEKSTSHFDEEDIHIAKYGNSQICMISNEIYENNLEIDEVNFSDNIWIFTNSKDQSDKENKKVFNYIFLDEVEEKFPKLFTELKKKKGEKRIKIVKEKDGNYRFQKAHKELFFDNTTMASFQGDMKLNPVQWFKMNTAKVLRITSYLIVSLVAMIKIHWIFTIVFIACLLYNIRYWFTAKGTFGGGNVCPGKVISVNPDRIAVATNLSQGIGNYPVLKFLETRLLKEDKEIGKFIPTISIYYDNPHGYPFWSEFHPVPVSHGITDKDQFKFLMSKFDESDFEEINEFLHQINSSSVGTFKVNEASSGWKNFKHVDINKGVKLEGPIKDNER